MRQRIAFICGIVGGAWAVLSPLAILLPLYVYQAAYHDNSVERGFLSPLQMGDALEWVRVLAPIAALGALALAAVFLRVRGHRLGRPLLWICASILLAVSIVGFLSIGILIFPAAALLLVAAIALKPRRQPSPDLP